jgi:hypothetical protein
MPSSLVAESRRVFVNGDHHLNDDRLVSRAPVGCDGAVPSSLAVEEAPVGGSEVSCQQLGVAAALGGTDFDRDFPIIAHVQCPLA